MNDTIKNQLRLLGLTKLLEDWDDVFKKAKNKQPSYHGFLSRIIESEYFHKMEKARLARIKRAKIPETLVMETFPFTKQPRLKKKLVLDLYDSMRFITQKQELIFIGPTGCGKTGLATSFLIHAINQGCRGYFIDFRTLIDQLFQAKGDHTETKTLKRFESYEILLIDELGYTPLEKDQAGLFFDLMKARSKKQTTLITTQLGFEEWGDFLRDTHITAALLDRITVQCTIFNLKECISIRPKNIVYATSKKETKTVQ
jgi:DNA replication protein DnaC